MLSLIYLMTFYMRQVWSYDAIYQSGAMFVLLGFRIQSPE